MLHTLNRQLPISSADGLVWILPNIHFLNSPHEALCLPKLHEFTILCYASPVSSAFYECLGNRWKHMLLSSRPRCCRDRTLDQYEDCVNRLGSVWSGPHQQHSDAFIHKIAIHILFGPTVYAHSYSSSVPSKLASVYYTGCWFLMLLGSK